MQTLALMVVAAAVGIDIGWQQLDDGSYEYIIQIEPEMVDALHEGRDILSDLPPALRNIRRYRITVGNDPLPHEGIPPELIAGSQVEDERDRAAQPDEADLAGPELNFPSGDRPGPGPAPLGEDTDPRFVRQRSLATPHEPDESGPDLFPAEVELADEPSAEEETPQPRPAVDASEQSQLAGTETNEEKEPPQPFDPPPDTRPLQGMTTSFIPRPAEGASTDPIAADDETPQPSLSAKPPTLDEADDEATAEKPWIAFSLTLVGLFLSLGGNCYLAWVAWGQRTKYRALLEKLRSTPRMTPESSMSSSEA